jgi:ribosomal protein S7
MPQNNIIPDHHAVSIFLNSIHHPTQKSDAWKLLDMMYRIKKNNQKYGEKPLWVLENSTTNTKPNVMVSGFW